jgi:chromosome segregation ATPase|tara:strand:+ start:953 stop:1174 length:222 start_codon:yes stop_codon:yes gene_type:complete
MTEKADYQEIINEYKEQVRVLKEQLNELTDAGKSKDSALKRTLQKLQYVTEDLDKANTEIKDAQQGNKKTNKE